MRLKKLELLVLLILCASVVCQCSDDTLAPFEPEVNNATDSFQLQATGVTDRSTALTYGWNNTGLQATVNHSTTSTAGTARLIIEDAVSDVVYDELLVPSLNETTATGVSGTWTLRLVLSDYSGTLNFRVQKR